MAHGNLVQEQHVAHGYRQRQLGTRPGDDTSAGAKMRTSRRLAGTFLLITVVATPAALSAQRGRGGMGGGGERMGGGGGGAGIRNFPAIPHEPMARAPDRGEPLVEPGRPASAVPYVRDDHWYGHAAPGDARFNLARPFQAGHFGLLGPSHVFDASRIDVGARRLWLPGGMFQIAAWDWAATAPWCWTCDQFVVYADPDHPGWYLLYDTRMGEYVHAEFLGP
jgi:hypothetical protein